MMNDECGMMNERQTAFQFIIPHSSFIIFVLLSAPFSYDNRDGKAINYD
jgi:hypothetical protein